MNVPARIADGERLYRDVSYYYGPAAPWINGLALKIFGRHFLVLEGAGLLAAALLFAALYRLTARAGSPLSALLAVTWSASLCIGAPNGGSFVYPYSFGALFALAGAFGCLALSCGPSSRARQALSAVGLALALLGKPEIGAAAAFFLLLALVRSVDRTPQARGTLAVVGGGSAIALLLYGIAFAGVPWRDLFPEGPFALFSPPPEWRALYRMLAGFAHPERAVGAFATALFLDLAILALAAWVASRARDREAPWLAAWVVCVAAAAAFFCSAGAAIEDRLPPLLSPLPLISAVAALWLLRRPLDPAGRAGFLLFGFSAAVASRVLFGLAYGVQTTPHSILAFPGLAASAAVLVLDWLPRRLPAGETVRRLVAVVWLAFCPVAILRWSRFFPRDRSLVLNTSAGALRLPAPQATAVAQTLQFLAEHAQVNDGLTGYPAAGFFNFVTRLRNPMREEQFYPGEVVDERRVASLLEAHGPRFLLLANQPSTPFGPVSFGRDYATTVWSEVERRYRLAASFGDAPPDAPVGSPRFFIRIYERRADVGPSAGK